MNVEADDQIVKYSLTSRSGFGGTAKAVKEVLDASAAVTSSKQVRVTSHADAEAV